MERLSSDEQQNNKRYILFKENSNYYYVDAYFNKWVLICPLLVYFIKFPLYQISYEDFKRLKSEKTNQKTNILFISILGVSIGKLLSFTFKTSMINYIILNIFFILIGIYITLFFVKKKQKYPIKISKVRKIKIKYILKFKQFISIFLLYFIVFGMLFSYIYISINSKEINIFFSIIMGILIVNLLWIIPSGLCISSKFKVIDKEDKYG